jgi:serine phosphatase RsbU (regulator of sigma subunit)
VENDIYYLFSDGYSSQFKHKTKETLKLKRMKELINQIYFEKFEIQQQRIIEYLNQWKGDEPQVDDILVIGFKVTF